MKALFSKFKALFDVPALHQQIADQQERITMLEVKLRQQMVPVGPIPTEIITDDMRRIITNKVLHDLEPMLKDHWLHLIQSISARYTKQPPVSVYAGMMSRDEIVVRVDIPDFHTQFPMTVME